MAEFGYHTVPSDADDSNTGAMFFKLPVTPEAGTISSISFHGYAPGKTLLVAVYSDDGGVPDALLASITSGGGAISTTITVPVGPDQQASVTVTATATDLSGNEGARATPVTKRVDRLAPGAPK